MERLYETIWSEWFWLPNGTTWTQIARSHSGQQLKAYELVYPVLLWGPLILFIRKLWDVIVAVPVSCHLQLSQSRVVHVPQNDALQSEFRKCSKVPETQRLKNMCEVVGWSERQLLRWWRRRRCLGKQSQVDKFCETSWRLIFYTCSFFYGIWALYDKPYVWDMKQVFTGYPNQLVPSEIWWYYQLEMGFYCSLVYSVCSDARRKDFLEMLLHHLLTLLLMSFTWNVSFVRGGCLILLCHDTVDPWLEAAKLAKYAGRQKLCDASFVIFTVLWWITRLTIYPFWILWSIYFDFMTMLEPFPAYWIVLVMLCLLQLLHVIWFYMIVRMLINYLVLKKVVKDGRSESEYSDSDNNNDVNEKKTE